MASFNFNAAIHKIVTGLIDLDTHTFKMLLTSGTVLGETEKDTFDFRNDITTEVTGTGYTAGGAACTLTVAAVDNTNNDVEVTCAAVSWPTSTITATGAVIYKNTGTAATDEVLCYIDFGGTVSSTGATFTVTPTGSLKFQN